MSDRNKLEVSETFGESLAQWVKTNNHRSRQKMLGCLFLFCQNLAKRLRTHSFDAHTEDPADELAEKTGELFDEALNILGLQERTEPQRNRLASVIVTMLFEDKPPEEVSRYLMVSLQNWWGRKGEKKKIEKNLADSLRRCLQKLCDDGVLTKNSDRNFSLPGSNASLAPKPDLSGGIKECVRKTKFSWRVAFQPLNKQKALDNLKTRKSYKNLLPLIRCIVQRPENKSIIWHPQELAKLLFSSCEEIIETIFLDERSENNSGDSPGKCLVGPEKPDQAQLIKDWVTEVESALLQCFDSKNVILAGLLKIAHEQPEIMRMRGLNSEWVNAVDSKNPGSNRLAGRMGKILGCSVGKAHERLKKFQEIVGGNLYDLEVARDQAIESLLDRLIELTSKESEPKLSKSLSVSVNEYRCKRNSLPKREDDQP